LAGRVLVAFVPARPYNVSMTNKTFALTALGLFFLTGFVFPVGCSDNTGYLITPVPADKRLQETVIERDPGLIVSDKIVLLDVDGLIMNARTGGLFSTGENPVTLFVEKLDKAQADPNVKAVVVRINSPGGGVTASDIMYERLVRFRAAKHVPVVVSIEDVGASGGYFLACGADEIYAMPTSITGSIGVIVQLFSFSGTMAKLGIDARAITSGRFKDIASPFKALDKEDQVLLQEIVNGYYEQFLTAVGKGRPKLSAAKIRELADGRVYTGPQALANGLVDRLGFVEDAVAQAKKLSGTQRMKVVMYNRPASYRATDYASAKGPGAPVEVNINLPNVMELAQPQFLYLWSGASPRK
jgi:protease-4